MWRTMLAAAGLALCVGAASCAGRVNGPAEGDWDLAGTIAAVEPGSPTTRVTVDLTPGAAAQGGRAVLLVSPDTEVVVQRADGTTVRGGPSDLVPGARIRARHAGAELRSLPPQYRATHVRVLAGP